MLRQNHPAPCFATPMRAHSLTGPNRMNSISRTSHAELRSRFRDGMSLPFGGFMGIGTPDAIVRSVLDSGVRDLTFCLLFPEARS